MSRAYLLGLAAFGSSTTFFLPFCLVFWCPKDHVALRGQTYDLVERKLGLAVDRLAQQLPIEASYGTIRGIPCTTDQLASYEKLFSDEMLLYPAAVFKKLRLTKVVLCQQLTFNGQARAAIPHFEDHIYLLDVAVALANPAYGRRALHHDLFHYLDYRDDGLLYQDTDWLQLNEAKFVYGNGGVHAQNNPRTGELTSRYPGFLNHYSTTGVEEDKAEVFAHLVVDSSTVVARAQKDPIISRKAERIKQLVRSFCNEMDNTFWQRANNRVEPGGALRASDDRRSE